MQRESLPYISLLALVFGVGLVASRYGVAQIDALTFVALRLIIASICFGLVYALHKGRALPRDRRVWRHAPVLGVLGTAIPMTLIIASLQFQSSGMTALLLTAGPVFTVLMAHFFLDDEKLSRRTSVGVALALCGAVLLIVLGETGLPDASEANPIGYAMLLVSMIVFSVATIYVRRTMHGLDTFDVGAVRMWTAVLVVLPVSILLSGFDLSRVTGLGVVSILYTGVGVAFLGLLLELGITQRFGATAVAMTSNLIPVAAMITGALLLDETITAGMIAGLVLIVGGVSIISRRAPVTSPAGAMHFWSRKK
jgi:drug/metabolite transporter (DMT)-like permease